jgi:hypothetical protein
LADQLATWAPEAAAALREMPARTREVLLGRARLWVQAARRNAPRGDGELARAIDGGVTDDGRITVTMPAKYVAVEDGGTIRPRGQWLAVPVSPAAASLPGPRSDVADLFVLTLRDGRRFLASRAGAAVDIRWRLVRQVTIRGQGFMARAALEAEAGFAEAMLDRLSEGVA